MRRFLDKGWWHSWALALALAGLVLSTGLSGLHLAAAAAAPGSGILCAAPASATRDGDPAAPRHLPVCCTGACACPLGPALPAFDGVPPPVRIASPVPAGAAPIALPVPPPPAGFRSRAPPPVLPSNQPPSDRTTGEMLPCGTLQTSAAA